jgi:hypothetical protein
MSHSHQLPRKIANLTGVELPTNEQKLHDFATKKNG